MSNIDPYDPRIDTLFTRFTAIYGQLWLSIFQNEKMISFAKKEWSQSLKKFDSSTLQKALCFFKEQKQFPPSLPQFIEHCKSIEARKMPITPRETRKPANPEMVKQHIKAMLEKLRT